MVPPTSHKVSRVSWYFGSCCCLPVSHTGLSPCLARFPKTVLLPSSSLVQSITPKDKSPGLGSSHFARRYSGNRCFFLFLRLLRCFSSPGSPPCVMCWRMDTWGLPPCGFPHSDTCGSPGMCPSPQLFAACRVFRRLPVPRHPPRALSAWPVPPSGSPERDALSFAKKLSRKIYKYDAELKNYWYLT